MSEAQVSIENNNNFKMSETLVRRMTEKKEEKKIILLSEAENTIVGAIGGATETSLQMPILTAKICFQEGRPLPKGLGLYRGIGIQVGSMAPVTAIQVASTGFYQKLMGAATRKLSDLEVIGCAVMGGFTCSVVYGPADFMMIHQQRLGMGLFPAYSALAKEYGAMIPYRGVVSCGAREAVYVGGYLGFAPVVTQKIRDMQITKSELMTSVLGSCAIGVPAALASHPIDTAKTVFQADLKKEKYTSATYVFFCQNLNFQNLSRTKIIF